MDIFDFNIDEFEKTVDDLLKNISSEELLEELLDNGLIIDEYDSECYYIGEDFNNMWVHKIETKNFIKKVQMLFKKNNEIDLLEAA